MGVILILTASVALRKESVDRNGLGVCHYCNDVSSLSARRAWIEIIKFVNLRVVDGSLSARRAWIEITCPSITRYFFESLSARRAWIEIRRALGFVDPDKGRSPQGERG